MTTTEKPAGAAEAAPAAHPAKAAPVLTVDPKKLSKPGDLRVVAGSNSDAVRNTIVEQAASALSLKSSDSIPRASLAAERMRRCRQRRRAGLRCLLIELRETEINALIRKGLLKQETRNDANAVIEALYAFLDRALGRPA